jgi:hypothetical protein
VTEKLGLASKDKLASTREAYNVLMDTARAARVFYPLSSFYMENGLAKVIAPCHARPQFELHLQYLLRPPENSKQRSAA